MPPPGPLRRSSSVSSRGVARAAVHGTRWPSARRQQTHETGRHQDDGQRRTEGHRPGDRRRKTELRVGANEVRGLLHRVRTRQEQRRGPPHPSNVINPSPSQPSRARAPPSQHPADDSRDGPGAPRRRWSRGRLAGGSHRDRRHLSRPHDGRGVRAGHRHEWLNERQGQAHDEQRPPVRQARARRRQTAG